MSDYRAIAAVTATLKAILQDAANEAVGLSEIRLGAPIAKLADETAPTVNIFLFRTSPNAAMRNANLPSRRADGTARVRTEAAINLHYIFSFYGSAAKFVPERLLGAVTVALEATPVLPVKTVEQAIADAAVSEGLPGFADADLPKALSRVRIAQDTVSLEEFSKIWSIFFQVPYGLSAAYVCSHLILESQERLGDPLPVTRGDILVGPISGFALVSAGPDASGPGPVLWEEPLHLAGKGLGRIGTSIRIGEEEISVDPDKLGETGLSITLAAPPLAAPLPAGIHVVQAVAPPPSPTTPPHLRRRSNALAFALHPAITVPPANVSHDNGNPLRSGTIKVDFSPPVRAGQQVTLTLDAQDAAGPRGLVLDPALPEPFPPAGAAQLSFAFEDVPPFAYLVRAHVDGLASLPERETQAALPSFGQIVGPVAHLE